MDDVIFIAKKHKYMTKDEKVLPSVSEIISPLSKTIYDSVDPEVLAVAALKGSTIHGYTVELDNAQIIECEEELSGYLLAYVKAVREHDIHWRKDMTEKPMRYFDEYAGTIDRYGDVDGKKTLVDIKTPSSMPNKKLVVYEAQLNLYRRMIEAHEEKVEQMYVLHLKKDGEYSLIEIPIDDTLADMCLYIHKRMKERKRRIKKNG